MTDTGENDGDARDDTDDPRRIRSIAVHREDVATALEATLRTDRHVVLRITPPFYRRMRARIHERGGEDPTASAGSIHLDPRTLVDDVPAYPEADETARRYPDVDLETRRERHLEAIEEWRVAVREAVVDRIEIDPDGVSHEIRVAVLG
ncbi:hypothetical protein [Halorubrum vacuolatum]|uniref:DUF8009 domain-containing protein n=1 Tax=Halorubrum vacuolatum TaxID=63740 RepID=A0A238WXX6_HALVU|nr:hypothetical protein [Halorubrum vacuolatum]SNR51350.1 hypothetical protein SAMN06264855_11135 [Halorubrum vacuolatum]